MAFDGARQQKLAGCHNFFGMKKKKGRTFSGPAPQGGW
jgi:hypothetical protein